MKRKKFVKELKKVRLHEASHLHIVMVSIIFFLASLQFPLFTSQTAHKLSSFDYLTQDSHPIFLPTYDIEGKAYVVYDIHSKRILSSKNATTSLPLASLSKVATALTALSLGSSTDTIVISKRSIEGGFDLGLKDKQEWKLGELLKYMLVFSSNDAAYAVASHYGGRDVFISKMNEYAKTNNLDLTFTDPAGLDVGQSLGGYGNAEDVAKLFFFAYREMREIMDSTTKHRQKVYAVRGPISGVPNTNQSIQLLSGAEASKTGFTDLAGGNLGVIVDMSVGRPMILIVLGSTKEGRFRDVSHIYSSIKQNLSVFNTPSTAIEK
ncbi:MAG: hypothetical protein RI935_43 [Candidatus Parcubacteria bacterium]|jgi:D-alanyl-D-alanine carboxypeptidase